MWDMWDMWKENIRDLTMICKTSHVVDKNIIVSIYLTSTLSHHHHHHRLYYCLLYVSWSICIDASMHYLQGLHIGNSPRVYLVSLKLFTAFTVAN